ncbi:MAG: mechanosensitive ion channel [Rhizobiaceae bacterium]|nr:mechanosensitive ion channel [Rhizobiaceae bacterium]
MEQYLNPAYWQNLAQTIFNQLLEWAISPQFYAQIGAIIAAIAIAWFGAKMLKSRLSWFSDEPIDGRFLKIRQLIYAVSDLLFAAFCYVLLGIAVEITLAAVDTAWLVRLARGISVIFLLYSAINRFIPNPMVRTAAIWIGIPVATLQVFGYLDQATAFLDSISFEVGNIRLSLFFLAKTLIVGAIFFWAGRISNTSGQKAIRNQNALDTSTQELLAKIFQIVLFGILFVLMMQVLGLDLTALAIFGGAVGVGLGFGLQQIAANFISGMIILFERSLTVGDYIELEDGRGGILKELNMRSTTLETFDGKEIMVPNEKFITDAFTNWTRDDPRQRYEVEFSVAYETDLHKVPPIINAAVSKHPRVLQEPEKPDCELRGFGDSGVNFGVEFWVDGLDDGPNKFSSDVLFLVWDALKENNITIPFPQREVRVVSDNNLMKISKVKN